MNSRTIAGWVSSGFIASALAVAAGCSSGGGSGGVGGAGGGGGATGVPLGQPGCTAEPDCGQCGVCMDACMCQKGDVALCSNACAGQGGSSGGGGTAGAGASSGSGGGGGSTTPPPGDPGAPCQADGDCKGTNPKCLTEAAGWPNGYCTDSGCTSGGCPTGSECFQTTSNNNYCLVTCTDKSQCPSGYACHSAGACVPACTGAADCDAGEVCNQQTGLCEDAPCTTGSCPSGLTCDTGSGKCVPDTGSGPPPGPGPDCTAQLPERDCKGTAAYCGELSSFEPKLGPGYDDYPINGETASNQYRSYARRDMQMLIKWAAAYVDCKAKGWNTGNGGAIGLGDMSEKDGSIPGTSIGQPGHPKGTHVNGYDMDIAYYQAGTPNNYLRSVCEHKIDGKDQYHCVKPPHLLDLWRTTMFLGALFTSQTVRVIGVDGQVGPLVESAMPSLCATGWLPQYSCDAMVGKYASQKQYGLVFETTNTGQGWYQFHHHHLHISLNGKVPSNPTAILPDFGPGGGMSLAPRTAEQMLPFLELAGAHEHAIGEYGVVRRLGRPLPAIH